MAKPILKKEFQSKEDKKVLELCKEHNLSVSSVRYSRGHDGDCMDCNLKVGRKIVGTAWDDSWGGELDIKSKSMTVSVEPFEKAIREIVSVAPKYKYRDLEMSYCMDTIIELLVEKEQLRKDCAKKVVVRGTKVDNENARVDVLLFNVAYNNTESQNSQVRKQMTSQGYVTYEIVNATL